MPRYQSIQHEFSNNAIDLQTLDKPRPFLCLPEIPVVLGKAQPEQWDRRRWWNLLQCPNRFTIQVHNVM